MKSVKTVAVLTTALFAVGGCGLKPAVSGTQSVSAHCPAQPKIILINPNSNDKATAGMAALAQKSAGSRATVVGQTNQGVPALLTTPADMKLAAEGVVAIGKHAAKQADTAGIIVSAFSDPGLAELRAALPKNMPLAGIGEEAFHEAAKNGRPFAIVTVTPDAGLLASFKQKAEELGYGKQYHGVVVTPGDPNELLKNDALLDKALHEAVQRAVKEHRVQAVIMGGGPLSAPAARIQSRVDVPLVIAVEAATKAVLEKHAARCSR